MNKQNWSVVMMIGVFAGIGALVLAFLAGSHLSWSRNDGRTNFDIRIATQGNGFVTVLGTISILALLLGGVSYAGSKQLSGSDPSGGSAESAGNYDLFLSFLRRVSKSQKDVWLGGVCGGLGEHSPIPSWVWRVIFIALFFGYGAGLAVYIVLWICLPESKREKEAEPVIVGERQHPGV